MIWGGVPPGAGDAHCVKNFGLHFFWVFIQHKTPQVSWSVLCGAVVGIRTRDLILTMDALYRLSYDGVSLFVLLRSSLKALPPLYRLIWFSLFLASVFV
jgi:hypothetical protein